MNDLRFALRQLLKNPAFTGVAVLSLALGIAANVIVLGWIQAVLVDTLPGTRDPGRLAVLSSRSPWGVSETMSYPNLRDVAAEGSVFEDAAGSENGSVHVRQGEKSSWAWAELVTENTLSMLGVEPLLGRVDFPKGCDLRPGSAPQVVLSEAFWRRFLNADPEAVGRTLDINRHAYTVVGVVPARFRGMMPGLAFDLWVPHSMHGQIGFGAPADKRGWNNLHAVVRLRPGVDVAQADAVAVGVARRLREAYPQDVDANQSFTVVPVWKAPFGAPSVFLPLLQVLATAALLVLGLVVANLANLLLARATQRQREMSVRLALGAGRGRIVRQLLTESLLLAGLGGLLGYLLALWGVQALGAFLPKTHLPIAIGLQADPRLVAVSAGIALLAGLLFGSAPAWQSSRVPLVASLNEGFRGSEGPGGRQWLRRVLAVAQVALALVLVTSAVLCVRSFAAARQLRLGLDPVGVWIGAFHLDSHGIDGDGATRFIRQVGEELRGHPAVVSVAFAETLPLGFEDGPAGDIALPGIPNPPGEDRTARLNRVSPGFFETLRIPILEGREFTDADTRTAPARIVVNRTAAERLFPGRSPIGLKCVIWGRTCEVVGVAESGKYRSLNEAPRFQVWVPQAQWGETDVVALVRLRGDVRNGAGLLQAAVRKVAPDVKPYMMQPLEEFISPAFLVPRIAAVLLTLLGVVALALALLGIYGLMSFLVNRRTREMGIRMALGASRREVLSLVLRHGMTLAGIGLVVGLPAALGVTRLLRGFLLGVDAWDPATFVATSLVLAAAAAAATWIPARRAARVDPAIALRAD